MQTTSYSVKLLDFKQNYEAMGSSLYTYTISTIKSARISRREFYFTLIQELDSTKNKNEMAKKNGDISTFAKSNIFLTILF